MTYTDKFKNQALVEFRNGLSKTEVCRRYRITNATLNRWIDLSNIDLNSVVEEADEYYESQLDRESKGPTITPVDTSLKLKGLQISINGTLVTMTYKELKNLVGLYELLTETLEEGD